MSKYDPKPPFFAALDQAQHDATVARLVEAGPLRYGECAVAPASRGDVTDEEVASATGEHLRSVAHECGVAVGWPLEDDEDLRGRIQAKRRLEAKASSAPTYRCAGASCPGLPYRASETAHPASCAAPMPFQDIALRERSTDADAPLKGDEWTAPIHAAFPTRSGSHDAYATALRMVSNRHAKGELVALVNWLLVGRERAESKATEAWGEVKAGLAREQDLRASLGLVATSTAGVWYWQGDGYDHPASLSCPVVMSADTLRAMVAQAEAVEREADRLRHGAAIEGDFVCPEALRADRADAIVASVQSEIDAEDAPDLGIAAAALFARAAHAERDVEGWKREAAESARAASRFGLALDEVRAFFANFEPADETTRDRVIALRRAIDADALRRSLTETP